MPTGSPPPSSPAARATMLANRGRDTKPELAIRRRVHARGLRFYVNRRAVSDLRRTADLVFPRARVAVFVDGCFWHACPDHGTWPKSNEQWWRQKLEANVARDRETDETLTAAGWIVIRAWEHEDPTEVADRVEQAVRTARR